MLYLMLCSFSSPCDMFQGPEGPVGARGLRGPQVSNTLQFNQTKESRKMVECTVSGYSGILKTLGNNSRSVFIMKGYLSIY